MKKEKLAEFERSVKNKISGEKSRPAIKHHRHKANPHEIKHHHKNHKNSNPINTAHKIVEHKSHEEHKAKEPEHHQAPQHHATHHHKKSQEHSTNNLLKQVTNNPISAAHHHRPVHHAMHHKKQQEHSANHNIINPIKTVHHQQHHIHHDKKHHKHNSNHNMKKHISHSKAQHQSPQNMSFRIDKDVAMDFATKIHRLFDHLIKATVLFGSQATGEQKPGSDIDIIIIIDDAAINWDLELTSWYREELAKLIASQNYGKDLHINTIRLTTWWRDLLHGDPVVLNIIRNGQVLIDIGGFFNPIKALMIQGKIHSTPEAVYAALQRSPQHLVRSKLALLGSVEGVYWCMVEAAQAALITLGKLPPSPEHVTKMLNESFVETGIMKSDYVKWYRDIYVLHKQIAHGEIRSVKAAEIEAWQVRAEEFMKKMVDIIDKLIESRKNTIQKE